jgi:ElaA protein
VPARAPSSPPVRSASFADLELALAYAILRLRAAVFVVEQHCAYQDLDDRDLEPGATHWWVDDDGAPVSYLRLLEEPGGVTRMGRVVTHPDARGQGLSAHLVRAALAEAPRPVVIHAQAHLARWYRQFGFVIVGDVFDEDGIDHLPMRLD